MVSALGYVRITMTDPTPWLTVGPDVLGFSAEQDEGGNVRLRMDVAPFRYLIEPGDADGFAAAGWEVSEAGYAAVVEKLKSANAFVGEGDAAACAHRAVSAFVTGSDPAGNQFEVYHSRSAGSAFSSPIEGLTFVTEPMGLGHVVLPAPEFAQTSEFYRDLLGFGLSDELTLPAPAPGMDEMKIHFLHADNPRHHSLGLFNGPAPSGCVHLMAEVSSLDQVGAALDRVNAHELPITASLGRHANDGMVSFYFLAPAGIPIEFGYDGQQFDWSDFTPTQSTVGDLWGHEYNFPE